MMKGHVHGGVQQQVNKGKASYGMMLIVAFGAAILGVMLLHKLRDRRISTLLLQEKDRDLLSLHFLLLKERDNAKEVRRKNEEMKGKIYTLRTQKMELNRKVLEMQSTISSLKDEQRMIELALEEKENKIKLLRSREMELNEKTPQLMALNEILKQKEVEIVDLKQRLELQNRVWSVSMDDPSKPVVNVTERASVVPRNGNRNRHGSKGDGKSGHEFEEIAGHGLVKKLDNADGGAGDGSGNSKRNAEDSREEEGLEMGEKNNHSTTVASHGSEVQLVTDEDIDVKATDVKGRMKMEIGSDSGSRRSRESNRKARRGKRWKTSSKNWISDENMTKSNNNHQKGSMRGQAFSGDSSLESKVKSGVRDDELKSNNEDRASLESGDGEPAKGQKVEERMIEKQDDDEEARGSQETRLRKSIAEGCEDDLNKQNQYQEMENGGDSGTDTSGGSTSNL